MILWNDQFTTGSEKIDMQHRLLLTNINHLEELLNITNPSRQDLEFTIILVDFLSAYVDNHFKFEEQCMESYRCPVHAQNKQAHEGFRGYLSDCKTQCEKDDVK